MNRQELRNTPLVLIIRDGWGRNPHPAHNEFNAIHLARTPVADALETRWPSTLIHTSGEDVGLPPGTMGNSEVGHQNIGAGRIVDQEIMRITRRIRDGSFFESPRLLGAFEHARRTGGAVHLLGLVSDGQVHSDLEHLMALIEIAERQQFPVDRLVVHAITDGRDTGPFTGRAFVERIEARLAERNAGRIGSVIGRYYAMDRDHRWGRVALAYACLTGSPLRHDDQDTRAAALATARTAAAAVEQYYESPTESSRQGDEFILPTSVTGDPGGDPPPPIRSGDAVIFFNFRGDRPREITRAFVLDDDAWAQVKNGGFDRGRRLEDLYFCTMAEYEQGLPAVVAFARPEKMPDILGDLFAARGLTQFRCAETEKFPHVTFFFNDYREAPFPGERRELIQSPTDVSTYDQKPEMSAYEVCDAVLGRLSAPDGEPLVVVNFANGDMVGHTGVLQAAIRAVEVTDECVGRIVDRTLELGGSLIVTADHGNAEQMWSPENQTPHTAHTAYDVPLFVVGAAFADRRLREDGRLGDIAPTLLDMAGLPQPEAMTGTSLLA
jgi:2,3-bisphosphoglycerate-independent phosphoglycerate mutase